jgi:hypothetical protein
LGDFNGDGKLDVAVGESGTVDVYLGNGDGTFQKPIQTNVSFTFPVALLAADLNNDGKLDLLVSNAGEQVVITTVLLGDGSGRFTQGASYGPTDDTGGYLAVGDFNRDGNLDFVVSGQSSGGGGTREFLGNGDGTFRSANVVVDGLGVPVVGDFNGDGKLDLAVPIGFGDSHITVSFGNGDGTFQGGVSYDTELVASAVTAADLSGDGKLDLITDGVVVLLNDGSGTFSLGATVPLDNQGPNEPIGVGELTGGGQLDLAVVDELSASQQRLSVLLGSGKGKFQNPLNFDLGAPQYFGGLGIGDFGGTGALGIVVAGDPGLLFVQSVASMSPTSLSFGNQAWALRASRRPTR